MGAVATGGSCLVATFAGSGASGLRAEIADYIAAHPSEEVAGWCRLKGDLLETSSLSEVI